MKNMFYNYDHNITADLTPPYIPPYQPCRNLLNSSEVSIIYNIFGDEQGVQVKYQTPCTLYFNLENLSVGLPMSLADIVGSSNIKLEIFATSRLHILDKTFTAKDVFNDATNDLIINLDYEDMQELKRDVYRIKLSLAWDEAEYTLFSDNNGFLVVR